MEVIYICTLLVIAVFVSTDGTSYIVPCSSPRYIELSKTETLVCSFEENAFAILWYNSTDYLNSEPILYLKEGVKSGIGYTSGEFDIGKDGSLIISNVSISHGHYFTVIKLNSSDDDLVPYLVLAIVTVTPPNKYPTIALCGLQKNACFVELSDQENISCSIDAARPAVPLQWVSRTAHGDKNVTFHTDISSEGNTFSTFVSIYHVFTKLPDLVLLVCRATYHRPYVHLVESIVVVQNEYWNTNHPPLVSRILKEKSELKLPCSRNNLTTFLVWKKRLVEDGGIEVPIGIFVIDGCAKESFYEGYNIGSEGSLIVAKSEIQHEGIYTCLSGNGTGYWSESSEVIIYVPPVPPYPIVEGCQLQKYCILEKYVEGYLTCSLLGIRPSVQLEWNTFPRDKVLEMTLTDHSMQISQRGYLYDISLTSKYRLNNMLQNRITVACRTSPSHETFVHLETKFDLFFLQYENNTSTVITTTRETMNKYNPARWIVPVFIIVVVILGCASVCTNIGCKLARDREQAQKSANSEELIPVFEDSRRRKEYTENKETLCKELKIKYEQMYEAIQPIPFFRQSLCSIKEVFVEGGIEFTHSASKFFGTVTWKRLKSYDDIFTDPGVSSKQYVLEGDPGYGKSTFCLKLAHDWCNGNNFTGAGNFEIFVLLILRRMNAEMSIAKAVKTFILPADSRLTEEDVATILRSSASVLLVLDGYDEYLRKNNDIDTVIDKVIKREMLQSCHVLLTTRSSCLPNDFAPQTKRLRLTGFDAEARNMYISKVVADNSTDDIKFVKERLSENPILSDLCQVPLLFVMFVHISHYRWQSNTFTSATTFFRYVISCIHGHMHNKLKLPSTSLEPLEKDHKELDKLAFESLGGDQRQSLWTKDNIQQRLSSDCFGKYVKLGILIVEEFMNFADKPGVAEDEHIRYTEFVRFYHELFCEWYAAHYLSELAFNLSVEELDRLLKHLNPYQFQYVYRFACGLKPAAGKKIIQYLKRTNVSDEITILCIIEHSDNYGIVKSIIKDICSRAIELRISDSRMMQRAAIQLLEIASKTKNTIPCLRLWDYFSQPNLVSEKAEVNSRLSLPTLKGIMQIEVYECDKILGSQDVENILLDISRCLEVKTVKFFECLMPISFECRETVNFEVLWYTRLGQWYVFDGSSSQWRAKDGSVRGQEYLSSLTELQYEELVRTFGQHQSNF